MDAHDLVQLTRRDFLVNASRGVGVLALANLLRADGLAAPTQNPKPETQNPPHFAPRAKRCIFLYMEGGVSQVDLFDPKPKLQELDGQAMPESLTKNVRFAFLQKDTAKLMASPHPFRRYGRSGLEMSTMLPHLGSCADDIALIRSMHTEAFNHHPGELLMYCGSQLPGRPSVGSWVNYALGSSSQNLPGYVVLPPVACRAAGSRCSAAAFSRAVLRAYFSAARATRFKISPIPKASPPRCATTDSTRCAT